MADVVWDIILKWSNGGGAASSYKTGVKAPGQLCWDQTAGVAHISSIV